MVTLCGMAPSGLSVALWWIAVVGTRHSKGEAIAQRARGQAAAVVCVGGASSVTVVAGIEGDRMGCGSGRLPVMAKLAHRAVTVKLARRGGLGEKPPDQWGPHREGRGR
jgi:hypothetical protein